MSLYYDTVSIAIARELCNCQYSSQSIGMLSLSLTTIMAVSLAVDRDTGSILCSFITLEVS